MIDKLIPYLRRHFPLFYKLARDCYWKIRQLKDYLQVTKIEEKRLAKRKINEKKK